DVIDQRLAIGANHGRWYAGNGYTTTTITTNTDGTTTTTTTTVSADDSRAGKWLDVYYNDLNGNNRLDDEDDIWIEFRRGEYGTDDYYNPATRTWYSDISWYHARPASWAERQGLALYLRFDDGGGSIEDYAWHADWRSKPVWKHSIRPPGLFGIFPPLRPTGIGGVDYQWVTQEDASGYAWVIDAVEPPTNPVTEIQTLSNVRNAQGEIEFCYRPAPGTIDSVNLHKYDILTASILTEASDPEGVMVNYRYYWLHIGANPANVYVQSDVAGAADWTLTFADGVLVDSHTADGSLPDNVLLATDSSLDLYNFRSVVRVGDIIQLAVVGVSESGKSSQVMLSTITVSADDLYKVPDALTFVSFLPLTPEAGDNLTVSLQTVAGVDGYIVLEWYRNLLLYNTTFTRVQAAGTYTITLAGKTPTGDLVTIDGDVWSFKAYYKSATNVYVDADGKEISAARSRVIPPTTTGGGEWFHRLIGSPFDGELAEDGTMAGNNPPTAPTSVTITPGSGDQDTIFIANAVGAVDPEGHIFSYQYQWYIDGQAVLGETMQFFPANGTTIPGIALPTDPEGTTPAPAPPVTNLAEGDRISVAVYAMDIFGARSTARRSDVLVIQDDLADAGGDDYASLAYEPNNTRQTAGRLLPMEDVTDPDDEFSQEHYFHEASDVDWFWFIVPETLINGKKWVLLETNDGNQMYNRLHRAENDWGIDTQMALFNSAGKLIYHCDDYGNPIGFGGTKYARFEGALDPGIYYVQISLAVRSTFDVTRTYFIHYAWDELGGKEGPTAPTTVVLTPANPGVTEDLVCRAEGALTADDATEITYLYVWYRNGVLVPLGNNAPVFAWNTARYVISQAKNFGNSIGAPNTIPAAYTLAGQTWQCAVYAMDANGYSHGVMSNPVTINTSEWDFQLRVAKTYKNNYGPVTGTDQAVNLGWRNDATFGFDPTFDSALPIIMTPGSGEEDDSPLTLGRMYSIGLDNTYSKLNTDVRPYGRATSWFIKVEMGDSSAESMILSWDNVMPPPDTVGNFTITQMRRTPDGTYLPVPGTT
ncbi:MAG: hypothetical protein GX574_00455, partial [Lentisphaerae bacterium]|nr:hypothetical protein [Lentisphaerota bacterium]